MLPGVGAAGCAVIVMETVPMDPTQVPTVAPTEYVPEAAVVTAAIVGFCKVEVKPFGPVHE